MPKTRAAALSVVAALFVVALTPTANGATPGTYKGKLYTFDTKTKDPYPNVKVSLKVSKSGKKVTSFKVSSAPLFCLNIFTGEGRAESQAVLVPSAKIKGGGKFSRTYVIKKDGEEIGRQILNGKVSGSKATGTIETQSTGCSGTSRFKLKRK